MQGNSAIKHISLSRTIKKTATWLTYLVVPYTLSPLNEGKEQNAPLWVAVALGIVALTTIGVLIVAVSIWLFAKVM